MFSAGIQSSITELWPMTQQLIKIKLLGAISLGQSVTLFVDAGDVAQAVSVADGLVNNTPV